MKKLEAIFSSIIFGSVVLTTVHSLSNFSEHFTHLGLIGALFLIYIGFLFKETILQNKSKLSLAQLLVPLLLVLFVSSHVLPTHMLMHGGASPDHSSAQHPCCMSLIPPGSTPQIVAVATTVEQIQQGPQVPILPSLIYTLTGRSPPEFS